jgi:hypothetical protein
MLQQRPQAPRRQPSPVARSPPIAQKLLHHDGGEVAAIQAVPAKPPAQVRHQLQQPGCRTRRIAARRKLRAKPTGIPSQRAVHPHPRRSVSHDLLLSGCDLRREAWPPRYAEPTARIPLRRKGFTDILGIIRRSALWVKEATR